MAFGIGAAFGGIFGAVQEKRAAVTAQRMLTELKTEMTARADNTIARFDDSRAVKIERSTLVGAIVTGPWVWVKRTVEETPCGRSGEFESIGEIMRRMRREGEATMTDEFSLSLSRYLDCCLAMEQALEEGRSC